MALSKKYIREIYYVAIDKVTSVDRSAKTATVASGDLKNFGVYYEPGTSLEDEHVKETKDSSSGKYSINEKRDVTVIHDGTNTPDDTYADPDNKFAVIFRYSGDNTYYGYIGVGGGSAVSTTFDRSTYDESRPESVTTTISFVEAILPKYTITVSG